MRLKAQTGHGSGPIYQIGPAPTHSSRPCSCPPQMSTQSYWGDRLRFYTPLTLTPRPLLIFRSNYSLAQRRLLNTGCICAQTNW